MACLLIAEVTAYYKANNKTLYEELVEMHETCGYYREVLVSLTLKGKNELQLITTILSDFRSNPSEEIAGRAVLEIEDYQ